ncbi:MAG: hypothetical protein WDO17_09985 [Alphaproteobacteria bacterium]
MSKISYYFTLFKKFQVFNHVPTQTVHGNPGFPTGGFNLNDPNAPFNPTNIGVSPLTAGEFVSANNPLWAILNSRASGNPGFAPVTVAGNDWPTMPPSLTPEWTAFQVTPPAGSRFLDAFDHWIAVDHQTRDTPNGVIAAKPASFTGSDPGAVPFVCSMPGDQGARPASIPNFWATSLIFLVDANTGATVTPGTLDTGQEYYLAAVIGNRGNTNGGRSFNQPQLQFAASVMVWNTFLSPGVQLPSLSNLTLNDTNGIYEQYFLRSGQYDVVGFRLNVQTVFNGIIAAINDAVMNGLNLGGFTPEQWVHNQPAHLCAKVVARLQGTNFPNADTSPEQDSHIAQKNLAPFNVNLVSTDANPDIIWKNFLIGQPLFFLIKGAGKNTLLLTTGLGRDLFQLYIAMPARTYERLVRATKGEMRGLKEVPVKEFESRHPRKNALPFPEEAVILQVTGEAPALQFGPMEEGQFGAVALGIEYIPAKVPHGTHGDITIAQESLAARLDRGSGCYKVERAVVGGFTLQLRADDPNIDPKGRKITV